MLYANHRARRVGCRGKVQDVFGGGRHAQWMGSRQRTSSPPDRPVGTLTGSADTVPILTGVRVLDRSTGIAGPYCTKVLADAGADVVKVERTPDPLRRWGSGALFEYLNAAKRSITDDAGLRGRRRHLGDRHRRGRCRPARGQPGAGHRVGDTVRLRRALGRSTRDRVHPAGGVWLHRSTRAPRPARPGRRWAVGEWVAGTYAAATALAAWREARRSGVGEHVDVAMLDCMAVTMVTFPSLFASFLGWPPVSGTGRVVEVPSIEPTTDGWAVFTTNSAQQFQDFCVMIGRTDWLDDPEMARVASRFARRDEFLRAVHDYTTKRSTAEILEDAAALRIPSGPVLNGATVPEFDHFIERGVFQPNASGRFAQPRVPPTASAASQSVPPGPCPSPGRHRRRGLEPRPAGPTTSWQLPLAGLRIVDLTAWWAGPARAHALACLGPTCQDRVGDAARPDALFRPPAAHDRPLVGVGSGLPRREHRQAGPHARPDPPRGHRSLRAPGGHRGRPHRELHPAGDGSVRSRLGAGPRPQPVTRDGAHAGLRPRWSLARPHRVRPDDGVGDGDGVADGFADGPPVLVRGAV